MLTAAISYWQNEPAVTGVWVKEFVGFTCTKTFARYMYDPPKRQQMLQLVTAEYPELARRVYSGHVRTTQVFEVPAPFERVGKTVGATFTIANTVLSTEGVEQSTPFNAST